MPFIETDTVSLGAALPSNSRLWNLQIFTERHTKLYGEGNIMREEWPERNVHSDDAAAKREGLSGAVAAAPQVISQIQRMMLEAFGIGWLEGGSISVKMIKPVLVDDFTTARGTVVGLELDKQAGSPRVVCDVYVERADGTRVMTGTASALNKHDVATRG